MTGAARSRYSAISPAKDEEKFIETTIQAVVRQTVRPLKWIIVDDASRDRTPEIIERYARVHAWIRLLRLDRDARRQLGSAEIRAFEAGFQLIWDTDFDFVVKLDCDLDFPPDYFERLIAKFDEDQKLGIASGGYVENHQGRWQPVKIPAYHASGASKMVRAKCFREIGGFVLFPGWDTIDEIRAQAMGWKTRHFPELKFYHLKHEGSAEGRIRTNLLHGEVYYVTGGGKLFFFLKVLHRMIFGTPFLCAGLVMLWGYLRLKLSGRQIPLSDSEVRFYRQLQNRRLLEGLGRFLGLNVRGLEP